MKINNPKLTEATGFNNSTEFSNCQPTKKHLCKSWQQQQITAQIGYNSVSKSNPNELFWASG
jgi:hypothetical protein